MSSESSFINFRRSLLAFLILGACCQSQWPLGLLATDPDTTTEARLAIMPNSSPGSSTRQEPKLGGMNNHAIRRIKGKIIRTTTSVSRMEKNMLRETHAKPHQAAPVPQQNARSPNVNATDVQGVCENLKAHLHRTASSFEDSILYRCPETGQSEAQCVSSELGTDGYLLPSGKVWAQPYGGEFGWDASSVLLILHTLAKCGLLERTSSCGDAASLYYFSPQHENDLSCRRQPEREGMDREQYLGITVHPLQRFHTPPSTTDGVIASADGLKLIPPLLAEHYRQLNRVKGQILDLSPGRPLMVLVNKYESEWGGPPINFLDIVMLIKVVELFEELCPGGSIVYSRNGVSEEKGMAGDHQAQYVLKDPALGTSDFEALRAKPSVVLMQDLFNKHASDDSTLFANEVQGRVLATSRCFVGVQGGMAHLLLHFGGKHVLYHQKGTERYMDPAFKHNYEALSGQEIFAHNSYDSVLHAMREQFTDHGRCLCSQHSL